MLVAPAACGSPPHRRMRFQDAEKSWVLKRKRELEVWPPNGASARLQ